ncbi:MaoC/PaaZ C-terminal domain-containing protein [Falsibacillus pallidus]|uniref:Acyl dehydratase n=1 Tax=Falsibacillus pallidus TaxID=493781 RepID=A0A370GJ29_9BACI|nr:MaoC/PaaZ C-terminal domain-containing protein [Falsibacillus pallidus]RDI43229.1 acyl dehydratase [Falsibacillus pallidus]
MKKELPAIIKTPLTHSQLVKYAGASGDFNPIHTVVPVAQEAGLKDCIAHGMLIMGMAGEAICTWFPRESLRKFQVRFQKMTFPGEKLSISGRILGEETVEKETYLLGEVAAINDEGEMKLKGTFRVKKEE